MDTTRQAKPLPAIGKLLTVAECRTLAAEGVKFYFCREYEFGETLASSQRDPLATSQRVKFRSQSDIEEAEKRGRKWSAVRVKSGVVVRIVITIFSQDTRIVVDTREALAVKELCENLGVVHIITAAE